MPGCYLHVLVQDNKHNNEVMNALQDLGFGHRPKRTDRKPNLYLEESRRIHLGPRELHIYEKGFWRCCTVSNRHICDEHGHFKAIRRSRFIAWDKPQPLYPNVYPLGVTLKETTRIQK